MLFLVNGNQGILQYLEEVNMVVFGEGIELCGDSKVFPYSLFALLFSIGIHLLK